MNIKFLKVSMVKLNSLCNHERVRFNINLECKMFKNLKRKERNLLKLIYESKLLHERPIKGTLSKFFLPCIPLYLIV